MKSKVDRFILLIVAVILLAYFFPQWGSKSSLLPVNSIASIGISLIFFFYGLKLSSEQLKNGLQNWRLHLLVQSTTFILFPLLVLPFYPLLQNEKQELLWLACLFLAALPSTVSSSVVMTAMAKGNVTAAIFNASISGILGILITPLWMGLFLQKTSADFNFSQIYLKLTFEIVVPVILGLSLHRYFGKWALRYGKQLTQFDKSVILFIIYKSFSESFMEKIFGTIGVSELLLLFTIVLVLFFFVYFFTGFMSRRLNFSIEDQIAAQFCGTKKSLVHGTVFSKIIFGTTPTVGLMLLPLMLFHAIQLIFVSVIATKLGKRK